jgi:hypothetical protein
MLIETENQSVTSFCFQAFADDVLFNVLASKLGDLLKLVLELYDFTCYILLVLAIS